MGEFREFIITKKIAKYGKQAVVIIPSYLKESLHPGTVVEVRIKNLEVGK